MAEHFNDLTPSEAERLALLVEECGEVQQAVGKILRHGYESRNPLDPNSPTNRETLASELGDLRAVMRMLIHNDDVSNAAVARAYTDKIMRVGRWLHHPQTSPLDVP